jgi:4-amino-4-deoxy-L-arabinose transferase-like glycosyltransferase
VNQSPVVRHLQHLIALLLLSGLLFFLDLGTLRLTDRDEGSNAEAAREMVETGDWISPTLNYEPRFAKPVFVYWLMSGAYRLWGVSEFTARLPSAVFGVALIFLQYWFLNRLRGPTVALLGALMLLLNVEIVAIGRVALTDSVLIFFTTLALFGFWLGLHGEGRQRYFLWLFYGGMALGTLTKGPLGVLVPLLAVLPYLTLSRRWREFWQVGFPVAGPALLLVLAAPWYAAMLALHGSQYTTSVKGDTVGRFFTVIGGHGGTIFMYIPVLLFGFFPWSGVLPVALYHAFKHWRGARSNRDEEWLNVDPSHGPLPIAHRPPASKELEWFAALWLVAGLMFFSLSATRLPHYIGPLFPAAAILTASFWARCLTDPNTAGSRIAIRTVMALGYLLGFALAASPSLYARFIDQIAKEFPMAMQVDPGWGPYAAGFVLLAGVALVGYYGIALQRYASAFWISAVMIGLVLVIAIKITLPRFSQYFIAPPQDLAYAAGLNLGADGRLILYGPPKPSLIFYAQRKAIVIRPGEEEQIRAHLTGRERTMIVLPSRLRDRLPAETNAFPVILERFGYSLLANEPMVKVPPTPPTREAPAIPGH